MKFENHKEVANLVNEIQRFEDRIQILETHRPEELIIKLRYPERGLTELKLPVTYEDMKFQVQQSISVYKHRIFVAKTKLEKL